jgi:hypothetical protein
MASCAYCDTTIFFGGKTHDGQKYCNDQCAHRGLLANVASQIPQATVDQFVARVHSGNCPKCEGQGPVDLHTSHKVWSALLLTSWSSSPEVCCQSCGTKQKLGATAFSLFLGWWGFPWGILMTPMQIGKNIWGMFSHPDPTTPSAALIRILRLQLAAHAVQAEKESAQTAQAGSVAG